ncbi:MAG: SHD1 domain-containing protein [Kiritimatiellae bacterium]|jgi:predicted peptidase|nr:SHD1 domain-containing protein [Kiritimatiellia bacterium]
MVRPLIILAICVVTTLPCAAEMRTWTSIDGKTIEAEFVRTGNGRVMLRGADGKMMNTSFTVLSKQDQTFIENLYKEAKEKADAEAKAADEAAAKEKQERQAVILAKWKPGEISSYVTTNATRASYHVYIPSSFNPDKPPPLVYAFSPGGNGKGQLNSMKKSAEKYGWIVVGCDKLKNGMDQADEQKIEDDILSCVQTKVPHDPKRVYLSGMSGGALRSYQIAGRRQDMEFAGILAFGGWLGGKECQKNCSLPKRGGAVAMVNGDQDKAANSWMQDDGKAIKRRKWEVKVFQFPGGHIMAPPEVIDEAIAWIQDQPLPK